jgi:hypothetical protein
MVVRGSGGFAITRTPRPLSVAIAVRTETYFFQKQPVLFRTALAPLGARPWGCVFGVASLELRL